jgi:hypothetical protein
MKILLLALMVTLLPTSTIAAGQSGPESKKPAKPITTSRPIKSNSCAQYGAGFIQIQGTTTCVKVGGSVTFESGGRR